MMPEQVQPSHWQQIFQNILPVLTLLLGYFLAKFDRYFERKRKIRNMKIILFKETLENFSLLNRIIPEDANTSLPPIILAIQCRQLSLSIYETYLDRFDSLKENELNRICEAYFAVKGVLKDSEEYIQAYETRKPNTSIEGAYASKSIGLISSSRIAFEKIQLILKTTNEGAGIVAYSLSDRGSALSSYANVNELWKKDKEGGWIVPRSAQTQTELSRSVEIPEPKQNGN
jgi:hypothetical protein